jgi:hypothetical protein
MDDPSKTAAQPLVIGWKEYVDFPEWHIRHIKAKVDTGARTSALDVLTYELRDTPAGPVVEFRAALRRRRSDAMLVLRLPVVRMALVRNSNGMCEQRPVIETIVRLGPVTKRVQLTLTNRSNMRFRLILGRKALEEDFVVDVSRQYLLSRYAGSHFIAE